MKIQTKKNGLQRVHSVIISDNAGNKNGIEEPPLYLEIDNIYDYYKQKQDLTLYNYFESMCRLVSLMCLNRNYAGITILTDIYSPDFVIDCFLNENLPLMLRSNMAKILITLHIDKEPLE